MSDQKLIALWSKTWEQDIHQTEYAQKRIKSAQAAKMTPVEINTIDYYGYFQGDHGRYETFLDYCPCGDFRRSKLPCKHIYRLAIELGLMDIEVKQNKYSIPTPQKERAKLDEVIDLIETLSENTQRELQRIASCIRSTNPFYETRLDDEKITELLNSEIITEPDPKMRTINWGTKYDITDLLDREHIPYKTSMKKADLIDLCGQHIPEKAKQEFGEISHITIPTKFSPVKIQCYLHRKFDNQSYYDENTGNYTFGEVPLLETELPNDDVTKQLIKHGHYRPVKIIPVTIKKKQ